MTQKHRWNSRNVWMTFNVHVMCLAPCIMYRDLLFEINWSSVALCALMNIMSSFKWKSLLWIRTPYIVCCTCKFYVTHKNQTYLGIYQYTTNSHQKLIHIIMKNTGVDCFKLDMNFISSVNCRHILNKYKSCLWN